MNGTTFKPLRDRLLVQDLGELAGSGTDIAEPDRRETEPWLVGRVLVAGTGADITLVGQRVLYLALSGRPYDGAQHQRTLRECEIVAVVGRKIRLVN